MLAKTGPSVESMRVDALEARRQSNSLHYLAVVLFSERMKITLEGFRQAFDIDRHSVFPEGAAMAKYSVLKCQGDERGVTKP
ncbi:MAG: hypothetical protein V4695_01250 [Pseudomonadota bacterium]